MLNPTADYNWLGGSESGRMEVWKRGLGYMAERPFLGVGARAFGVAEGHISVMAEEFEWSKDGFKWSAAHNSLVQIGAELGVFGLVLFVSLLVVAFRTALTLARGPPGRIAPDHPTRMLGQALVASLIGYSVAGFFLSQAYAPHLYALLGLLVGLHKVTNESRDRTNLGRQAVVKGWRTRSPQVRGTALSTWTGVASGRSPAAPRSMR